jgi:hypothetical protein
MEAERGVPSRHGRADLTPSLRTLQSRSFFGDLFAYRLEKRNASFHVRILVDCGMPAKKSGADGISSQQYGILSKKVGFVATNREQRRPAKSPDKAPPGRTAPVKPAGSSMPIAERFAVALAHHWAGWLAEAESLYRPRRSLVRARQYLQSPQATWRRSRRLRQSTDNKARAGGRLVWPRRGPARAESIGGSHRCVSPSSCNRGRR